MIMEIIIDKLRGKQLVFIFLEGGKNQKKIEFGRMRQAAAPSKVKRRGWKDEGRKLRQLEERKIFA